MQPATSSIKDTAGDGHAGDITSATLQRRSSNVVLTVTTHADYISDATSAGLFLNLSSPDGNTAFQAGAQWSEGEQVAQFVFDSGPAKQTNLTQNAQVDQSQITLTFPIDQLSSIGPIWKWQIVTTVDGSDDDTAPNPGDDTINPKLATLQ